MKPKDKGISNHQDRMKEIMRYATYLEEAIDNLSDGEIKTILFTSLSVAW